VESVDNGNLWTSAPWRAAELSQFGNIVV